ncbi:cAMP-dependent protein kinase catalytic subunit PRKX [Astathelohania contejeani]|uniref:cAMP-dependent protein kinase n=1 Tax=Astathelohania contejeani TaxID=164912 RepID=A0ABQ7HWJ1_9MICR|nr:cAMP-dependent protein kinase catalytic subunit PRKX [Thelohania contejeani]
MLFKIEDFEIIEVIGVGTFGKVELVKLKNTKKYFALKTMDISNILKGRQIHNIYREKIIMKHFWFCPFFSRLYDSFRTDTHFYLVMEYAAGGELHSWIQKNATRSLSVARFYAAEIVLALENLHKEKIVFRDLKPENILLSANGHIKIVDFGFAKHDSENENIMCGTPEYIAPEVLLREKHERMVDYWALGVLIYEMLTGSPPFYSEDAIQTYKYILNCKVHIPPRMDKSASDLILRLLEKNPKKRIYSIEEIKTHPFFKTINWEKMSRLEVKPPIEINLAHPEDTCYFQKYSISDINHSRIKKNIKKFKKFRFLK